MAGGVQIITHTHILQVSYWYFKHILFNKYLNFSLVEHNNATERNTPALLRSTKDYTKREISHGEEEQILHGGLLN